MSASTVTAAHDAEHIKRHVRAYIIIGVALIIDMSLAVSAYYAHAAGASVTKLMILGLAAVKLGIVAFYFRHLISSRWLVYLVLVVTVVHFIALILLSYVAYFDYPRLGAH